MGWFGNQIEKRREADQRLLEESLRKAAGAVLGRKIPEWGGKHSAALRDSALNDAIKEILKYYGLAPGEMTDDWTDARDGDAIDEQDAQDVFHGTGFFRVVEEKLDRHLSSFGLMRRNVELGERWFQNAFSPILAFTKEEFMPVAMIPSAFLGYSYTDPATGLRRRVGSGNADLFGREAVCFYRPMPFRAMDAADLLRYIAECVSAWDIVLAALSTLALAAAGLFLPGIAGALAGPVLSGRDEGVLAGISVCMFCVILSMKLVDGLRGLFSRRIGNRAALSVQASIMARMMSLPPTFFRDFSPGELHERAMSAVHLCPIVAGIVSSAGFALFAAALYTAQIFRLAPSLAMPAFMAVLSMAGVSAASAYARSGTLKKQMRLSAKESGMAYSMISGIQKIRLSGAEKRFFSRWLTLYAEEAALRYNPPVILRVNGVINMAVGLFANIAIYYLAAESGLRQASYFAFSAAFGALVGAFTSLSGAIESFAGASSLLEMASPVLEAEPEAETGREIVSGISGGLELEHVYFRYREDMPYVLRDFSMKIRPGEYVAIVGRTGCGKSTLMRLLLGFEKPEKGAIYYDTVRGGSRKGMVRRRPSGTSGVRPESVGISGERHEASNVSGERLESSGKSVERHESSGRSRAWRRNFRPADRKDIDSLDLASLRRKIGVVMQSGGLFQGDIYSNIVISAPESTMEDAWEAAETAGIAEDIRSMPMGMHTLISEGQGGISGGQKQRLMIARAVLPKPRFLIFDEATSALDNKAQRQVSEALDAMGCTRIVIAHRLSTIRNCSRILVLEDGRIAEEGTYEELIDRKGIFLELVERQRDDV